jgi:hypothetical protein
MSSQLEKPYRAADFARRRFLAEVSGLSRLVRVLDRPRSKTVSLHRRIALTVSVAALVSLPTASTALAGVTFNGLD